MKNYIKILLGILIPVLLFFMGIGIYYISYNYRTNSNIQKIENENSQFYELLNDKNVNVNNLVLYEEVFYTNGYYYLFFTEQSTYLCADGDILQGKMLSIESNILPDYSSYIELVFDNTNYILPSTWIAGGGSALGTTISFLDRAELRHQIVDNSISIIESNITIKIDGSYCLGKITF